MSIKVRLTDNAISMLLMDPEEVMLVDLSEYLEDEELLETLKRSLVLIDGVYVKGDAQPVIRFNNDHFIHTDEGFKCIEGIDDVLLTDSDIYTMSRGAYELYMHGATIRKHKSRFYTNPSINQVYIKFLKFIIDGWISQIVNYSYDHNTSDIRNYIKDEGMVDFNGIYDGPMAKLYESVEEYVTSNKWSLYFTRALNATIVIERACDYRVYEWTKLKLEEKI